MNKEIKEKWIAALRSNEYKQGHNRLRRFGEEYCCLGVLCDLAVKEGIAKWSDGDDEDSIRIESLDRLEKSTANLINSVKDWAGFSHPYASGEEVVLIRLNDTAKLTFKEISDVIESSM